VPMPSNVTKAERVIEKMPFGSWVDVRAISKDAQLSTCIMAKFLMQARRRGIVERRILPNGACRFHLWRRIA
jgi:hypothetical protein